MDTRQLYQFTAIDFCTRLRLVSLAEEVTLTTTKAFAQYILSRFPFPVRCVQTDNDSIFTPWYTGEPEDPAGSAREGASLHTDGRVVRRPAPAHPPGTPRLNVRVERAHQTDDREFYNLQRYATRAALEHAFGRWLWHDNHGRATQTLAVWKKQ